MRPDIIVGQLFPDYELSDHTGTIRSISEIQRNLPMVLHLARGGYGPKEHRFLRHLVDHYPDFKVGYTRIWVITKDNQLDINEFRDAVGAEWPFLSDPSTRFRATSTSRSTPTPDPMVPHTFVLEPGLRIFKICNGYWYWGRPTVGELHQDLRALLENSRIDFDLHAPGLLNAWDRGERDRFLVESIEPAIRNTEGASVSIKR